MAHSSQDLTRVETATIRLASGSPVVRVTIRDKTVEFQPSKIDKLKNLRKEIQSELRSVSGRPSHLVFQTGKNL